MSSAAVLIVIGAVLCLRGAWSLRLGVLVAGFGAGFFLAEAVGASLLTSVSVAAVSAGVGVVLTVVVSKVLFFVLGVCVGAVVGTRVVVLSDPGAGSGDADWLLAVLFVPVTALLAGLLADRWEKGFLVWATAMAGASLVLSGLGRLGTRSTDLLWRPDTAAGSVVFAVLWVVLTVLGHAAQRPRRQES